MEEFLRTLEKKDYIAGEKLISEDLIVAQKILVNMGLDFIPSSYVHFLRLHNGIKANGAFLCGATVDDDMDIVDKNHDIMKPEDCILLGYNSQNLLCYHYQAKRYQIIDKDNFTVLNTYDESELGRALDQIFNV